VERSFRPEELIYDFADGSQDAVGIVEHGRCSLIRIDESGTSTVMEELGPGGVFGRTLAFAGSERDSLEIVSRTPCEVLFIDYRHILKRCENACMHHSVLVQNMLRLMSDKAQGLSQRVDVLSRRSIREKLLTYLSIQAQTQASRYLEIPLGRTELAEYLCVDRSALTRELAKMKEEGILDYDRNCFRILE
jgi:CRP-like cAMP-binding protein